MRYLNSFFITSFIYFLCTVAFIYLIPNEQIIKPKSEIKKISLNLVEMIKPSETKNKPLVKKEIEEKKEFQKFVKKQEPKKVIEKKIKKKRVDNKNLDKKFKKIVQKKPKKVIKKIETKTESKLNKKVEVAKKSSIKKITPTLVSYEEDFLNKNLVLIKKEIQKHIKYSNRAKRLNIQGEVLVSFKLTRDGIKGDIVTLSGHRLLIKSTIKAIYKASMYFPEVNKDITIKLPIVYKLI